MASSGQMNTNTVERMYLNFSWSIKSQNIPENKTTIEWKLTAKRDDGNTAYYVYTGNYQVKIAGQILYSTSSDDRGPIYHNQLIASGTFTMAHDEQGKKTFSAYVHGGIYTYAVSVSASQNFTLDSIPRKAQIHSLMNFNDETENIIFGFKNPGNFTINIEIKKKEGTVVKFSFRRNNIPNTKDSNGIVWYNFKMTESERETLRNYMKNLNSMSVELTIETVISGTTHISSEEKTVSIVNATPTVTSFTATDINTTTVAITNNNKHILEGKSNMKIVIEGASAKKGATIKSYVVMQGETTKTNTSNEITLGQIYGENPIKVRIVDSRGNTKEISKTVKYSGGNIQLRSYYDPVFIKAVAERENGTGTLSSITFISELSYVCGENNTITARYRLKESKNTTYGAWTSITPEISFTSNKSRASKNTSIGHQDINKTFDIEIDIFDGIKHVSIVTKLDSAKILLSLRNNLVGINRIPQENQGTLQVNGTITANGRNVEYPPGSLISFAGKSDKIPEGYLTADGRAVSRTTYAALYTSLGTLHGAGDGSTTFNIPKLTGRIFVGNNTTGIFNSIGKTGGQETYKLTVAELPAHSHTATVATAGAHSHTGRVHSTDGHYAGTANEVRSFDSTATPTIKTITNSTGGHTHTITIANQGSTSAFSHIQPYIVGIYLIKY